MSRLKRCSFQLKQLGAGVAVVAALGLATPVVGQHRPSFVQKIGVDNPFANLLGYRPEFVDIDGDGDLDCFTSGFSSSQNTGLIGYYENTGDSTNAVYVEQTSANSPLGTGLGLKAVSFVDIDGDGDLDCFGTAYYPQDTRTLVYYGNEGTVTNPSFVEQTVGDNPLDVVVLKYAGQDKGASPSFIDIDNDDDLDCFVAVIEQGLSAEVLFYENTGTKFIPSFVEQTAADNPLNTINSIITAGAFIKIYFEDVDIDGDRDVFVNGFFTDNDYLKYYENIGTATSYNYAAVTSATPVDSVPVDANNYRQVFLLDIDGDTDLDVVANTGIPRNYHFWENQDSVVHTKLVELNKQNLESIIYPNPTQGSLIFEEPISGRVRLYSISGELVLEVELESEQYLNIEGLNDGIYFLEAQTEKGRIRKKVLLQK